MKKILFLINNISYGGAEQAFVKQFSYLRERSFSVDFAVLNKSERLSEEMQKIVTDFQIKNILNIKKYFQIKRFLRENKIEIIYSTLERSNTLARILKIFYPGIKIIIRESGMAERKSLKRKSMDILLNLFATKIIAVSDEVKKGLVSYMPFSKNKIITVMNGAVIGLKQVEIENNLNQKTLSNLNLLNVGSMDNDNKGQGELLSNLKELVDEGVKDINLTLVGDGKLMEAYQKFVKDNDLDNFVAFKGILNREELEKVYLSSDVFVLNSRNEGCPNVVLEAMSYGLPIISTNVGGVSQMIENGYNGYIYQDTSELKVILKKINRDKAFIKIAGLNSYKKIKSELNFDITMKNLINLFNSL